MIGSIAGGIRAAFKSRLLKTGQTTQYNSELDDGYYEKGVTKRYSVLTSGNQSGTTNVDLIHLTGATISFDNATSKILDSNNGLAIFQTGDTIIVTGSGANDGTYTIATGGVAAEIVVSESVADEGAGATISIAKREAHSNNCVLDLNTGLMWMRYGSYSPGKMGTVSDGKMPWTGQLYDIFQYCAACNTAGVGGYSDWRVPNLVELGSVMDYSLNPVTPDTTAFPSFPSGAYIWVSTTSIEDITTGWAIRTTDSNHYVALAKTTNYDVSLVRGGV